MRARIFLAALGLAASGAFGAVTTFDVPKAAVAPVADGRIGAEEWAGALRLVGAGTPVDARRAELLAKWDDGHLYLAVRSQTAPRGKLFFAANGHVSMNDSVELWFDPPKTRRTVEQKKFGSFQMIVNWKNGVYLCHHDPGYGLPSSKWKADGLRTASAIHGDEWQLEVVLPAADLGLASLSGIVMPVLPVRNYRIGGCAQKPFGPAPTGFMDSSSYARFRMSGSAVGKVCDWYAEQKPAPFVWETPEAAIVAEGRDVAFPEGRRLAVAGTKIPVPGAILLKTRTDRPLEKGWRRYFSSEYAPTGYLGFQEDANNGRTMLFFAHGFEGRPNVNARLKCPSAGRDAVVAVNFEPHKVTYCLNGVKQGETDLAAELVSERLGDLSLGGGEPGLEISEWTLYNRPLSFDEIKELSQGEVSVTGALGWYQEIESLALGVTCDASRLSGGELALTVRRAGAEDVAFRAKVPLDRGVRLTGARPLVVLHETVPTGKLPEGDYIATVSAVGAEEDALLEKAFRVKRYAWLGNDIGKEDRLVTGFTPVSSRGRTLSCVLRDYRLGPDGLPEQIVSDGEAILARPVSLMVEKDGKAMRLEGGEVPFEVRKLSETALEYAAVGKYKTVRARFEQDGLLKFDLVLPRAPNAERVWLEIPVKAEYATLFHACGEQLRANPAGRVPRKSGVVFKSRDIPQTHLSNFIPYCWVGTDTRGVSFAADWDRHWVHGTAHDAVEVVRETDGVVTIVLNLLNAPYDAKLPRTITLGIMASPVKPQPKGWRGWSDGFGYTGTRNARCLYSPPYWGGYCSWTQRYPAWGETDYFRKLREAEDTGKADRAYFDAFCERVVASRGKRDGETNWLWKRTPAEARQYVTHAHLGARVAESLHGKPQPVLYYYTCDADDTGMLAENATYGDSWGWGCGVSAASYADYAIWYLDKSLEAGMQGVYDDNTFVKPNWNWATGEAWIDEKGEVHPSCGIWAGREYRRRQAVALMDRGLFPWVTMHHTNANILPKLSFGMSTMGMEWKYGKTDFQTRYTPDYIRTVCQGKQLGVFPTVIDGITGLDGKVAAERARVTRTMLAATLVHEIRPTCQHASDGQLVAATCQRIVDWGVDADDCEAFLHWDGANPVACSDKDVLVTAYRRGGRILAVVASWAGDPRIVKLTAKGLVSARNLEGGAVLPVREESVAVSVAAHDFALIELSCAGGPAVAAGPVAEYWVDNVRGDDASEGSRERPFRTMTRAAGAMKAGDVMNLVANAEPYRESLNLNSRFARMSARDGARKTVIDGHGATIDGRDHRPMDQWRDEGQGVWSSKQENNAWAMDAQGYWSGHPIVFRNGEPLAWRKSIAELEPDTYFLRKLAKVKSSEDRAAHNMLFVKLPPGVTPDALEVPVRKQGIWVDGVDNLVISNITAQYHSSDGFDTYWRHGIEFGNVRGAYNMDQGISAHSSGVTVRRSRFDHNAGCGAVDCCPANDGHWPHTVYEDCVFDSQSFRGGAEFLSGYFTLRRCVFSESPRSAVMMRRAFDFEISDCVFSNAAVKAFAAVWLNGACTGRVERCSFSGCEKDIAAAPSCRFDRIDRRKERIADKIAVWGYVLDKTPTACPFVIGRTEFSLERAAAEFGVKKAMYMNSCFDRDYIVKSFPDWDRECFENCIDNRLTGVQLGKLKGMDEVWCATTHGNKRESAIAIARMSLKHPNIVGVNFDDFNVSNPATGLSVEALRSLKAAMRAINPRMKVSVVSYVRDSNGTDFDLTPYRGEIDHVTRWKWVTETNYWSNIRKDIAELRRQVGPGVTILQGLYFHDFATGMKCRDPLPLDYFKLSVTSALEAVADGVLDGLVLPQVAWYSVPSHRRHYEWLRETIRELDGRESGK